MGRPKKNNSLKRIQIYLVPDMISNLRYYADKTKMNLSQFIRTIVEGLFLNKQERNNTHGRP